MVDIGISEPFDPRSSGLVNARLNSLPSRKLVHASNVDNAVLFGTDSRMRFHTLQILRVLPPIFDTYREQTYFFFWMHLCLKHAGLSFLKALVS